MAWVQSPVREGDQTGEDGILRCAGGGIVTTQHLSARSLDQLISPRETAPISLRHNDEPLHSKISAKKCRHQPNWHDGIDKGKGEGC